MVQYSFIDFGIKDFIRDENNQVIIIDVESMEDAEDWLYENRNNTNWTNMGTRYWCWNDEE